MDLQMRRQLCNRSRMVWLITTSSKSCLVPGGCLGGGGQPIPTNPEIREKRLQALYAEEMGLEIRKSHENPEVITLYQDFLEEPLSEKAHDLLHTHYLKRVVN